MGETIWIDVLDRNGLQSTLHSGEASGQLECYDEVTVQQLRISRSEAEKGISNPKERIQGTWSKVEHLRPSFSLSQPVSLLYIVQCRDDKELYSFGHVSSYTGAFRRPLPRN